ncbi:hypothetical protein Zmor_019932 [Zophobas morio]|uniref:Mediator of DNA damage checkpoint protein 1 n=1 Tax=Zophobas morio TaxID=2755281 RepID=A0AA38M9W1_9CUCU|nr:hypothetical protein Zmor_019932 [Zophobas morio]
MESRPEKNENLTRGCLTLNDKIYPVYDGHNTVGRNPDAVINIKNLNVSKHHAVITVVDPELHYISDFKSSNGTVLDNTRLTPLQLYKLKNGSSIKFGDVFCTYKTLEEEKHIAKNSDESQQFSENFYGSATQEVNLSSIPGGINFNEMPTQVFSVKELSVNEMPTQVHHFPGFNDESSNDSIDFATMQKATESQSFKCDKNSNSLVDSDDEAEKCEKNPTQTSSNSSQIRPVSINSKKVVDSETDDEVPSQICPVKTGGKNLIDSDSEDTEEYVNTTDQKSKYHISDDSETDIEGDDIKKDDLNEKAVVPESEGEELEENSMASFKLSLNASENCASEDSLKKNKVSKKVLPQDHHYCQALSQTQNEELATIENVPKTAEESLQSNEETNVAVSEVATELDQKNEEQEETKKESGALESDKKLAAAALSDNDSETTSSLPLPKDEERNEDVFNQPTQQFNFDFINDPKVCDRDQNEDLEKKDEDAEEISNLQSDEILNQSAPTEDTKDQKVDEGTKIEDLDKKEDEIFLQPTQTLDYFGFKPANARQLDSKQTSSKDEDDVFLQSTQILLSSDSVTPSNIKDKEDDIFLHPTQALEDLHGDDVLSASVEGSSNNKNESLETTQTLESLLDDDIIKNADLTSTSSLLPLDKDDEDVLLPPTQALELLHGEDKITELEKSLSSKNEEADDLFLPPTQALENLLSDSGPSSKDDDIFLAPNPFKGPSPLKKSDPKPREDDDSSMLQPTQAMEMLHEDGTHFNKVEDQLHEIFASQSLLCTQQLVDVLNTSRESDIIDDSIIQEETRRSLGLRKSAPLSEETVKEILAGDEDNEDEEIFTVNRSSSKVKTYSTKNEEKRAEEMKDEEEEQSSDVEKPTDDGENKSDGGATSSRRGRRKQDLEVREVAKEETINANKTPANKGRKLKKNLVAFDDDDGDKEEDHQKEKKPKEKSSQDRESSVESNTSEIRATRGRNRRQKNNDGSVSSKDDDSAKGKESTVEVKKTISQEKSERNRKGAKSVKSATSEDRESSVESSKTDSQNSTNSVKSRRGKKKQVDENEKDSEETQNQRRGRSKSQSITDDSESVKTNKTSNSNKKDQDAEVGRKEDNKSTDSDNKENRRGRSKRTATVDTRESSVESSKNSSQNSDGANTRRGKRKQKNVEDNEPNKKEKEKSVETPGRRKPKQSETKDQEPRNDSTKDNSQSSSNEANSRRTRRQQKNDGSEDKESQSSVDDKSKPGVIKNRRSSPQSSQDSQNSDTNKRGTRKQKLDEEKTKKEATESHKRTTRRQQTQPEPDDHSNTESKEEETKTRGRKKEAKSREQTPEPSTTKTKKGNKRKQEGDEPPETPSKKKPEDTGSKKTPPSHPGTPRKRGLKFPSYDSEDDFVAKVPKIETPVKPTRQSARKKVGDGASSDEVITVSSTSSEKSVITISSTPSVASATKPRRLSANSRRQKREEEEKGDKKTRKGSIATPVLATPERSRRALKPKVVFTMMDNPELESLIRTLGGSVVDTVDACTVLVTESIKRSQKLLCAVAQGKPICSPQWLYACKKAFAFVDPWDHILVDKEAEKKWKFSLKESLKRSSDAKLLQNYTFQVIVNNGADVIKGAIESCGGSYVTKNLAKCTTEHLVIVSSENNKGKYSKIVKQNKKIQVVEAEAIFDGTLRQEFKFNDFLLT